MRTRLGVSDLVADAASWPDRRRQQESAGIDEISVADHLRSGGPSDADGSGSGRRRGRPIDRDIEVLVSVAEALRR